MSNILTAYFSASGETAKLAKTFAQTLNSSLYEIKPKIKYSPADLDWMDKTSRSSVEMADENARPQIEELPADIPQKYIFLLFPIWWYQAPRIIQTFLESGDFAKKTIIPVCTSGGSPMGKTQSILEKSCSPQTSWISGKRFSANAQPAEIKAWTDSLKLI